MRNLGKVNGFFNGLRRVVIFLIIAFAFVPVFAVSAQGTNRGFEEANAGYRANDFENAARMYQKLVEEYPETAVFYYNLGNANVKLGKMSAAILAYEKALRLSPRDKDIRYNLNYARSLLEYRVEDNRNWYLKAVDTVLSHVTQREINFAVLAAVFLFLVSGILYFLFRQGIFWDGGRKFLVGLAIVLAAVALGKHVQTDMIRDAIVVTKECEARYGPSPHNQVAFRMGEGIKVSIMDRREDWSRVLLRNGESGWVKDSDLAEVGV